MMTRHSNSTTTHRRLGWLAPLLALGVATTSCSQSPEEAADDSSTTVTTSDGSAADSDIERALVAFTGGSPCLVSDGDEPEGAPIRIGSLQAPGSFASSGQAAQAFFECVNDNGGINGRPIELLVESDEGDPGAAAAIATRMIDEDGVVAFVGGSSLLDCGVNTETYAEAEIVSILGQTVSPDCYRSPNMAPTSAGPRTSTVGVAQYLVEHDGVESLVCLAEDSPTGTWSCDGVEDYGSAAGVPVISILYPKVDPDFSAVLEDAMVARVAAALRRTNPEQTAGGDGIVISASSQQTLDLLAAARERDLRQSAKWGVSASAYSETLGSDLGEYWWGYISIHTEFALLDSDATTNQAWLATIENYGAEGAAHDAGSQAGWLAARIVTDTLLDLDPAAIDRQTVTAAIRGVDSYPTDLTCGSWYFGDAERHNPIHAGRIVALNRAGRFDLVQGCEDSKDPELGDILADEERLD